MLKTPGYYKVKTQFKVNSTHCVNTYPVGMTIHIKYVYPEQVIIGSSNKDVRAPLSIFDNFEIKDNFTIKMKSTADRVLLLAKKSLSETLTAEETEELRAGAIDCAAYTNAMIEMKNKTRQP